MRIVYSSKFERKYQSLPVSLKLEAKRREKIFRENPKDHRLKTHKLKGRLKDYWAFSVTYKYRIVFKFVDNKTVYFLNIGDHRVYD